MVALTRRVEDGGPEQVKFGLPQLRPTPTAGFAVWPKQLAVYPNPHLGHRAGLALRTG